MSAWAGRGSAALAAMNAHKRRRRERRLKVRCANANFLQVGLSAAAALTCLRRQDAMRAVVGGISFYCSAFRWMREVRGSVAQTEMRTSLIREDYC